MSFSLSILLWILVILNSNLEKTFAISSYDTSTLSAVRDLSSGNVYSSILLAVDVSDSTITSTTNTQSHYYKTIVPLSNTSFHQIEVSFCFLEGMSVNISFAHAAEGPWEENEDVGRANRDVLFNLTEGEFTYIRISSSLRSGLKAGSFGLVFYAISMVSSDPTSPWIFPGNCGQMYLMTTYAKENQEELELYFEQSQTNPLSTTTTTTPSPNGHDPMIQTNARYRICQSSNITQLALLNLDDIALVSELCQPPVEDTDQIDVMYLLAKPSVDTYFTVIAERKDNEKVRAYYNLIPYTVGTTSMGSGLKTFAVILFMVALIFVDGWILTNSRKHSSLFSSGLLMKSFPNTFMYPADLQTSRTTFLVTSIVHLVCSLFSSYEGALAAIAFITPSIFGLMSVWTYSSMLALTYIILTNMSVLIVGAFLFGFSAAECRSFTPTGLQYCNDVTGLALILCIVAVMGLLMFAFIGYGFMTRLLRFKQYLLSSSNLGSEPLNFSYFRDDREENSGIPMQNLNNNTSSITNN